MNYASRSSAVLCRRDKVDSGTIRCLATVSQGANDDAGLPLWPLDEVSVHGLFGALEFRLPLNEQAVVLTGENGSGKSTLLRAIDCVGKEQWQELNRLPLQGLELSFRIGDPLKVVKTDEGLTFRYGGERWNFDAEAAAQMDQHTLHGFRWAGHHQVATARTQLRMGNVFLQPLGEGDEVESLVTPDWLGDLASRFHTKMISARRLEHRLRPDPASDEETPMPVVEQYARELRDSMRDQLSAYAAESRRQEKNLPAQIVHAMQSASERSEGVEELGDEVEQLREEVRLLADSLARVGLFQEEDPEQQVSDYPRDEELILLAVREVYSVTKERLERLTELRSDLELFSSFLNERFSHKRIVLSPETGIEVELNDEKRIAPSQLSSGEQQLLALAYELLFESNPMSVVLLDEPELSLHVAWLKGLLGAFLEMGRIRALQFIIATHAPAVLAGHLELERSLDLAAA
jgi:ABC-type transport system involved in cytochrome c biogenesis ATPase subunit